MDPRNGDDIFPGLRVKIKDEDKNIVEGTVAKKITKIHFHEGGIKVLLQTKEIGRVQEIIPLISEEDRLVELTRDFRRHFDMDEGLQLEFKASFRFHLDKFEESKIITTHDKGPHSIAKTIAAFANTDGGTLYIGIKDEPREILGLKYDYDLLQYKQNADGFLEKLRKVMVGFFGLEDFFNTIEERRILHLSEGDICVIIVKPSKKALIIKGKDQSEFYVRQGDDSIQFNIYGFLDHWVEHNKKLDNHNLSLIKS